MFKVIELDKEKSRTEMAFHDFVPPAVVKRIKSKKGKEVRTFKIEKIQHWCSSLPCHCKEDKIKERKTSEKNPSMYSTKTITSIYIYHSDDLFIIILIIIIKIMIRTCVKTSNASQSSLETLLALTALQPIAILTRWTIIMIMVTIDNWYWFSLIMNFFWTFGGHRESLSFFLVMKLFHAALWFHQLVLWESGREDEKVSSVQGITVPITIIHHHGIVKTKMFNFHLNNDPDQSQVLNIFRCPLCKTNWWWCPECLFSTVFTSPSFSPLFFLLLLSYF